MAHVPTLDDAPRRARRVRLGRDALMRDGRYWDEHHPEHADIVATVRKGFELVFGTRPAGRAGAGLSG